jgi:potassium-transporting ATPase KdpC subunit
MSELRTAMLMLLALTSLTGVAYPLAVTGIAQLLFPAQANGSLVMEGGAARGSALIGQAFSDPRYFWSRPSATSPFPDNAATSAGSNFGPTNEKLIDAVKGRIAALREADPGNDAPVPVDLVTASASGLDPDISPAAAAFQAGRVARARGIARSQLDDLIAEHTEGRWLGLLGEPRVNVLLLNLALDRLPAR